MKLLADWLPIIVFFAAYKLADLQTATALAIVVSLVMIGLMRLRGMAIDKMQWIGLVLIVVFGGATLLLQDERFIKIKPTVLYGVLALVLLVPAGLGRRPPLQSLLADKLQLADAHWRTLNTAWAVFFGLMAGLNLAIAHHFDTDTWVNFKLFGTIGLTLVFIVLQGLWMQKLGALPQESKGE